MASDFAPDSVAAAAAVGRYADRIPASVRRSHVIIGILQMTLACLVFALTIIGLAAKASVSDEAAVGSGIWVGPFVFVAGITGHLAGRRRSRVFSCVVTCLVFAILSCVLAFTGMISESVTAPDNLRYSATGGDAGYGVLGYGANGTTVSTVAPGRVAAFTTVYVTGVACIALLALEFVLAIVQAAFACRASCCCVPSARRLRQRQLQQPQQLVQLQVCPQPAPPAYTSSHHGGFDNFSGGGPALPLPPSYEESMAAPAIKY